MLWKMRHFYQLGIALVSFYILHPFTITGIVVKYSSYVVLMVKLSITYNYIQCSKSICFQNCFIISYFSSSLSP